MKVYNVWSRYGGCGYVRQYIAGKVNGYDGDYITLGVERTPEERGWGALNADIVVFHRPDDPKKHEAAQLLQQAGKKIVFDNDDTILIDDRDSISKFMQYQDDLMGKMGIYDLVTCSTEFLRKEYSQYNPNVIVLPNCVLPNDYPTKPAKNTSNKIRIGLVGSVLYKDDREVLQPIIEKLVKDERIQLVIFGMNPIKQSKKVEDFYKDDLGFWRQLNNLEWVANVPIAKYIEALNNLRLDIMIAPRKDNYFNRCKSNLKFLEAAMLEIPFIGQSFSDGNSPYDKDLDGNNGILCDTLQSWEKAIYDLVNDSDKRQKMGKSAKEYVLKNYNIYDKASLWEDAYNKLFDK